MGKLKGYIGRYFINDEIRRSEQLLKQTQRTVSAMFEANPQINILFDGSFKLIDCNPAAVTFFGYDEKESFLSGFIKTIAESIPEFQPDGRASIPLAERLKKAIDEGYVKFETELHMSGENIRNLEVVFKRIPYGGDYAIVGYIYDMTEIYGREKELKLRNRQYSDAVEEAKAANLAKSTFLATMSHEIRTPMNAILGITEINLHKDLKDNDLIESFEKISISGNMLLGIINDILDLSKIEAGKLELVSEKYEIASLISDAAQLNMMRIGSKEIEFELYVDENVPAALIGDELRVKQILNNVLSNAFKYTENGTVKLSVAAIPCEGGSWVKLVMSVSDTGQGMTKGQIAKLFEEYARFNIDANRSTEGTGLGMSITQNLLNLMGGKMTVESEPGAGSTFTFTIPQEKAGSAVLGREMAENLHNFRTSSRSQMKRVNIRRDLMPYGSVLIVDDVETNIYVARGLLAPYELKTDSADSGPAAIEKIKSGREYDIIFMDHMMPKMDGIEAAKIIREMGYARPIVALTANAVSGQADLFLGNGFDDYISKPIDTRQLNAVLNKLIRDMRPDEAEQVKQLSEAGSNRPSVINRPSPQVSPRLAEAFMRDAKKSVAILSDIFEKGDMCNDANDIQTFTIYVHGMKGALANFGRKDLSAIAGRLEASARKCEMDVIQTETPALIDGLKSIIDELAQKNLPGGSGRDGSDMAVFKEKLLAVKAACEGYDDKAAEEALSGLELVPWPQSEEELLGKISGSLLHSEFDEIADAVDDYLNKNIIL